MLTDDELGRRAAREDAHDRHQRVRAARGDRPDLLRPPVLPRPGRRGRRAAARLPAARRGDGAAQDRAAIGHFVLRTKEYLVALRVRDGLLSLVTMRFADEIRPTDGSTCPARRTSRRRRSCRPRGQAHRAARHRLGPVALRGPPPRAAAEDRREEAQGPDDQGAGRARGPEGGARPHGRAARVARGGEGRRRGEASKSSSKKSPGGKSSGGKSAKSTKSKAKA